MARSVRKVSRAKTRDQKKESRINKKWLIIICSVLLVIAVGLGVGLGLYYGNKKDDTYVSDKIYFNEEVSIDENHKVSFNKDNYQTIVRHMDKGDLEEEVFIFVYDGNAFYADEKDEEHYNKDYVELITRIAQLQYNVDQAKAAGINIEFYIVDVAVDSATNVGIFSDSNFGSFYSEDMLNYEPAFIYMKNQTYQQKIEYGDESHIISTKSWTDVLNSSIRYAINYIESLKDVR